MWTARAEVAERAPARARPISLATADARPRSEAVTADDYQRQQSVCTGSGRAADYADATARYPYSGHERRPTGRAADGIRPPFTLEIIQVPAARFWVPSLARYAT